MAKAKKDAVQEGTENTEAQGSGRIILPNGQPRADYIRDMYYNDDAPEELKGNRSAIKNAINEMYKEAGQEENQIPYQIVFAATKTDVDPRIAQRERAQQRAEAKAAKEAEAKAAKEVKAAEAAGEEAGE